MSSTITTLDTPGSGELWLQVMQRIAGPTEGRSLLDLCCRDCVATRALGCRPHVGIDVNAGETPYAHVELLRGDVIDILCDLCGPDLFVPFDLAICCDGIEHLTRERGWVLLREMERVSALAIIFTPLGPMWMDEAATDPDTHKSAWLPDDLAQIGWDVEAYPNWHAVHKCGAFFAWKRFNAKT